MRWVGFVLVLFGLVFAKTAVVVGLDADPPNLDPVFSSAWSCKDLCVRVRV
jgi:hypothetical protein